MEMLEQQQSQLVSGLRELYKRLQTGESWPGKPLKESHGGFPLTHDILNRLSLLHSGDSSMTHEGFEDDLDVLQQRCIRANGATSVRRRAMSEESEPGMTSSDSSHSMSSPTQSVSVPETFSQRKTPLTPTNDAEFYQSFIPPKLRQYAMPQQAIFNPVPAVLLQQAWAAQQMPLDQGMDIDMYSFNPSIGCDTQFYSDPNVFQGQDPMAAWPDSFDQLINTNALS